MSHFEGMYNFKKFMPEAVEENPAFPVDEFIEDLLAPGIVIVDQDLPRDIGTITLSYTIFDVTDMVGAAVVAR